MKLFKIVIFLLASIFASVGLTNANFNDDPYEVVLRTFNAIDDALNAPITLQSLFHCTKDSHAEDSRTEDLRADMKLVRDNFLEMFQNDPSVNREARQTGPAQFIIENICAEVPMSDPKDKVDINLLSHAIRNAGFVDLGIESDQLCCIDVHRIAPGLHPDTKLSPLISTLDHLTLNTRYFLQLDFSPDHDMPDLRVLIDNERIYIVSPSVYDDDAFNLSEAEKQERNRLFDQYGKVGEAVARLERVRHSFMSESDDIDIQRILIDFGHNISDHPKDSNAAKDYATYTDAIVDIINGHVARLQTIRDPKSGLT